ncbi:hypothetical protein VPH219E481_0029 [Vibrio phage 219E48-1]|nr:hypothetical protein PODOV021v1_p0015 [Vibrio phage 219E41.2]QZI91156.1 hypothetical protein PODOV060v1_p0062 [Vibrio phage 234P8]QZI91588.1 hypothetical protein PODOV086v1_p0004 [Vibrio phage 431E46.1]QZI91698.1 hypothetical protein PODOV088v1_p0037 [Vibrio phage 431E48.2]
MTIPIIAKLQKAFVGNDGLVDAVDTDVNNGNLTGLLSNAGEVQESLERIDSTGLGAQFREIDGSFIANYSDGSENTNTWYGGHQTVGIRVAPTANGQYTFTMPDFGDMTSVFDDLLSRGLGETYTLTLEYTGGNTGFVNRNRLTIQNASVSNGFVQGTFPTVLSQGQSATFRLERSGQWERLNIQQAVNPVPTFGEFVFQNTGWNNSDGSFLPPASAVLKGYAFPVIGSNPNDGTLRQGLLDSGVSDRTIYDGDFVVWTADAFSAWTNSDDWFVLPRNQLELLSRQEANFLAQVSEVDNRVDIGLVQFMANNALVWLSENVLAEAPFLNPSSDPNNPRSGDDYAYIGGQENRNAQNLFQFGQNRFGSFITVGITPSFLVGNSASDIFVRVRDSDTGEILDSFNLADDFVLVDDATFTNSTVTHFQRSTSINYPFLAVIEIVLTQVQEHFTLNPNSVNVVGNIPQDSLTEDKLSTEVRNKLNATQPDDTNRFEEIEARLSPYIDLTINTPDAFARFMDAAPTDAYPSDLTGFNSVSADNPRYTGNNTVLFIATPEPGNFALLNVTSDTIVALAQGQPNVEIIESLSVSGTTYFVYRVSGLTSGHVYEVDRTTSERVLAWPNDIDNLQDDVDRIDAQLEHAVFDLPDAVVQVLEHEVSVTEEDTPTIVATDYNTGLGNTSAQTVFYETSPNTPSGGAQTSKPINETTGDRSRRKLVYIPAGTTYNNQVYLWAYDGSTQTDLIRYQDGAFNAKVFVAAKSAGSSTETLYPAPSNRVSGSGVWISIPALTFTNGVPVPLADEAFFTRNVPSSSVALNIQYRGHANGNLFGASSATLAGVGGSSDVSTTFTLNDGNESATVEVLWRASQRDIRVSVTERVGSGLPTINDVQVILSYDETRTIPATAATTRDVQIEFEHPGGQVFAVKPSATGTLILVGDRAEIDTGYLYTDLFAAGETGHLSVAVEAATFLDYEDFEPIATTVTDLENHATLPQFGLFTTQYTHETIVDLATQLTVRDNQGNVIPVGVAQSVTSGERTAMTTANTQVGTIVLDTSQNRFYGLRNGGWIQFHN